MRSKFRFHFLTESRVWKNRVHPRALQLQRASAWKQIRAGKALVHSMRKLTWVAPLMHAKGSIVFSGQGAVDTGIDLYSHQKSASCFFSQISRIFRCQDSSVGQTNKLLRLSLAGISMTAEYYEWWTGYFRQGLKINTIKQSNSLAVLISNAHNMQEQKLVLILLRYQATIV